MVKLPRLRYCCCCCYYYYDYHYHYHYYQGYYYYYYYYYYLGRRLRLLCGHDDRGHRHGELVAAALAGRGRGRVG